VEQVIVVYREARDEFSDTIYIVGIVCGSFLRVLATSTQQVVNCAKRAFILR